MADKTGMDKQMIEALLANRSIDKLWVARPTAVDGLLDAVLGTVVEEPEDPERWDGME